MSRPCLHVLVSNAATALVSRSFPGRTSDFWQRGQSSHVTRRKGSRGREHGAIGASVLVTRAWGGFVWRRR